MKTNINRRDLLKWITGIGVTSLLGVSTFQILQDNSISDLEWNHEDFKFLNDEDQITLLVLIPAFIYGETLNTTRIKEKQLINVLFNIDFAILILPERTQDELRQLLNILNNGVGRWLLAGVWKSWSSASAQDLIEFLQLWRNSLIEILQSAYQGLHQIIIGSFYAEPDSWKTIHYSGPPDLSL